MTVEVSDILKIAVSMVFPDDVIMMNVFHVLIDAINGAGDDGEIGDDMVGYTEKSYNDIGANVSSGIEAVEIKVYVWDPVDTDWDEVSARTWTDPFADAADPLPHGVALVQSFRTTNPDVDGRKFWGGFTEGEQAAGSWVAGLLTDAIASGVDVIEEYTDGTSGNVYTPGVWSPTREAFLVYSGTFLTNAIVGYQRRRKPGVGI
jgi:hypothetical protein